MLNYIIVILLLVLSALFSGLTLGLMSLNSHELKRKMSLGDTNAQKIYSVRKNGNLLLTTLLLGNVAVNSVLAIFLGSVSSGVIASVVATVLIVIFGEIIPQAIFSRHAMSLGARVVGPVKFVIFILYPVSYPIVWLLDRTIGTEVNVFYSKNELMKIIEEHEDTHHSDIDEDEERIIKGALTFSDKTVEDIMTTKKEMHTYNVSRVIDNDLLTELKEMGHSRVPVYENNIDNIVGVLYLKQLLGVVDRTKTITDFAVKKVIFVNETKKLDVVFNMFLNTRHHLFVVKKTSGEVVGVVTLEDLLEEILGSEIYDEEDE